MNQTGNSEQTKQVGTAYVTVLKLMEIVCYFYALILTFLMFAVIFQINVWSGLALILFFIISTIVLKGRVLFWFLRNQRVQKNGLDELILSFNEARKIVSANFSKKTKLIIGAKLFVFNVLAEIFPLILITLLLMMSFVFADMLLFGTKNYEYLFNWGLAFFGVIGVLLALFQYHISSQRKSIKETLDKILLDIKQRVQQETDYHKFRNWVLGTSNLNNKKHYVVHAGFQALALSEIDIITKTIMALEEGYEKFQNNDKLRREFRKDMSKIIPKMNINLQSSPLSSAQRYMDLDAGKYDIKTQNDEAGLHSEYKNYFLDTCYNNIIKDIEDTYDLPELGSIFLSNINLINEEGNTFIKMTVPVLFWSTLTENIESENNISFASANEYINYLEQKIVKHVTVEMFRPYLSDSQKY